MKVFFAITLPEPVKAALSLTTQLLRESAEKGTFTNRDNLHLTLLFVGEVLPDRIEALASALQAVTIPAFPLTFSGLGTFRKRYRDIWWIGTVPCEQLQRVHDELSAATADLGFTFETQPYIPHLTLGREIVMRPGFQAKHAEPAPMHVQVGRISLMRSAREDGELRYTEIAHVMLHVPDAAG